MKKKTFDCIAMKNELQRELQEECRGLSPKERRLHMSERILADPLLAPLYMKAKALEEHKKMLVAEGAPEYRIGTDSRN